MPDKLKDKLDTIVEELGGAPVVPNKDALGDYLDAIIEAIPGSGGGSSVSASTQRVPDALTASSININGTDYNMPEGADKTYVDTAVNNAAEIAQAYIDAGLATKQNTLTAGENITIDENNIISAVGGSSDLPEITKDNQVLKTVIEQGDPKPVTSVVTDTKGYGFKRNYTKEELLAFLGDYDEKGVGYFE